MCQFIELVTFARCAFIFALRNITLDGYLETFRHLLTSHRLVTTHSIFLMLMFWFKFPLMEGHEDK